MSAAEWPLARRLIGGLGGDKHHAGVGGAAGQLNPMTEKAPAMSGFW